MFSIQQIISLFLMLSMELGIAGCGANAKLQQSAGTSVPPANIQDTQEPSSDISPEPEGEVTERTEFYQGFRMDNVLHAPEGDIHYHIYIPDSYDGSESYALYLTLPGYEGLYFQGVGQNLYSENFAFAALQYNDKMIVAAPQLNDWGKTSAEQTIALTEYLLAHYNIDPDRVYANGYSSGGETMSRVLGMRPDLFTAYLHCSSQWDGAYEPVVKARIPVYLVVGEGDEYYGPGPTQGAYDMFHELYTEAGLSEEEIDRRVKEAALFVGLKPHHMEKSPFELSGGQKRRVAIAGVIAMNPEVLILDEPTAGLDPKGRDQILGQILEYHREQKNTILLVSHSMEDVAKYTEKVLVMNHSRVAMFDQVEKVFSHSREIEAMGLAVAQVSRVFLSLSERGWPVPSNVYTVEQAKTALEKILGQGGGANA